VFVVYLGILLVVLYVLSTCRLGGLLSPFAAINLVAGGVPAAAESLFAVATIAACGAVLSINSKHDAEQPMEEGEDA